MSRFNIYEAIFDEGELAAFQEAYQDACRKLGLEPSPDDDAEFRRVRDDLARAIIDCAHLGERNRANLSAFAITFGLRNWHLPKR